MRVVGARRISSDSRMPARFRIERTSIVRAHSLWVRRFIILYGGFTKALILYQYTCDYPRICHHFATPHIKTSKCPIWNSNRKRATRFGRATFPALPKWLNYNYISRNWFSGGRNSHINRRRAAVYPFLKRRPLEEWIRNIPIIVSGNINAITDGLQYPI